MRTWLHTAVSICALTLLGTLVPLACLADQTPPDVAGLARLAIQPGDRCLVSGAALDDSGVAFIYRGRRVSLHKDAVELFLREPDTYFSRLQPRSALFQEDTSWSLGRGWLILGVWISAGLICGALACHLALKQGRPLAFWFGAGLVLNVIALITLVTKPAAPGRELPGRLGKIPLTSDPIPCPECAGLNHQTARICSACGTTLHPALESEVQRTIRE